MLASSPAMLFNSHAFIFLFLPLVLWGYFFLGKRNQAAAMAWLALASLVFYAWWSPVYVILLLASIVFNYFVGMWIVKSASQPQRQRNIVAAGIVVDLLLLAYYKYANFFFDAANAVTGTHWHINDIILPLGISFYTFTQIAFLVDVYQGKAREYRFVNYALFVTYFPHLIAGPVLHHKEMMPQFSDKATIRFSMENMAVGITIFVIGLFKKVICADGIAEHVGPIFAAPAAGVSLSAFEAWCGAVAYSLQIYFDFSGYSDMAIGISRMFGIILPLNFHSPYKAVNIIDLWRRWHMTLSRFLRDYLYIPLGGSRHGELRRYLNLMITMVLGGLWHGANWTYVVWGGMHGVFLAINHFWQKLTGRRGAEDRPSPWPLRSLSILVTFMAWTIALVVFRVPDLTSAHTMISAMFGANEWITHGSELVSRGMVNWLVILLLVTWGAPNTQEIMQRYRPALDMPVIAPTRWAWAPTRRAAAWFWLLGFIAVINLGKESPFLYFQF